MESLRNASPATVSRAGIIYVSTSDLGAILGHWDSHLMFWGYLSISFPFSVGWAPLVESWLIQRMDLGRMVKLGGSKIHATRQQTSYFNYILELKRHARCLLAPLSDCLLIRRFVCQFLLSSSMKWCQVMSSNCVGAVQLHFRYSFFSFVCHIYS